MSNKTLTVFEQETTRINQEGGFQLNKKEINFLERFNNFFKKNKQINTDIVFFKYINGKAVSIKATSYVGIIKVGKKNIQIIPKLSKDNTEGNGYITQSIRNLLFLLSYTKKIKIKETNLSSLKTNKDNIYEILVYLFAKNLLEIIKRNVNKQYISREDNLNFIRGKLKISNHLKINSARGHKFYLEFDDFCEDNIINQIFRYTIDYLAKSTTSNSNLKGILKQMEQIIIKT